VSPYDRNTPHIKTVVRSQIWYFHIEGKAINRHWQAVLEAAILLFPFNPYDQQFPYSNTSEQAKAEKGSCRSDKPP
jgi:hypothetical protein